MSYKVGYYEQPGFINNFYLNPLELISYLTITPPQLRPLGNFKITKAYDSYIGNIDYTPKRICYMDFVRGTQKPKLNMVSYMIEIPETSIIRLHQILNSETPQLGEL